jgi:hypothetical protein
MQIVRNQPVGYPAIGFLNPTRSQFYLSGYSQGAEVVVRRCG